MSDLHNAVGEGDIRRVKKLLAKRFWKPPIDVNERGSLGLTALHIAAKFGHRDIAEILLAEIAKRK